MQDFRGHITILPNLKWADYSRILSNPTELDMQRYISRGEQSSWPHISRHSVQHDHRARSLRASARSPSARRTRAADPPADTRANTAS